MSPPDYYQLDVAKLSLREIWRVANKNLIGFLYVVFFKLAGRPFVADVAVDVSGDLIRVSWGDIPKPFQNLLQPMARTCRELGIHRGMFFTVRFAGPTQVFSSALRNNDGRYIVTCVAVRSSSGTMLEERAICAVYTRLKDGRVIATTSNGGDMDPRPEIDGESMSGATVEAVIARQQERLLEIDPYQIELVHDLPAMHDFLVENERLSGEFNIRRGVYVPAPHDVLAKLQSQNVTQISDAPQPGAPANDEVTSTDSSRHPDVFAEIERQQTNKSSWGNAVLILVVSIGLFFALGAARWSWDFVLLLLPILFIHELGHYIAMKLFKYRDVKMFFIPLLGAAVSGKHYNVPGWKKAIVALAGPVPSIALAILIGLFALALGQSIILPAIILTLVLNGFNLLPILPFDGGHVAHAILFSRSTSMDVFFRGVAAFVLLGLGALFGAWFFSILAVLIGLSLTTVYKMGKIVDELKAEGVVAQSSDGQTLPVVVADLIVDRLNLVFPKFPARQKAQLTLQVFENLNARAPTVSTSFGLAGIHIASFMAAGVFAIIFSLFQYGWFGDFEPPDPVHPYVAQSTLNHPQEFASMPAMANPIVATFSDRSRAKSVFQEIKQDASSEGRVTLFGNSILIAIDEKKTDEREAWSQILRSHGADVIVDPVFASLQCISPSDEVVLRIEEECYSGFPDQLYLANEWDRERVITPDERLARQTFLQIEEFDINYSDTRIKNLNKELNEAAKNNDKDAVLKLSRRRMNLFQELLKEHCDKLLEKGEVHLPCVATYQEKPIRPVVDHANKEAAAAAFEQYESDLEDWHLKVGELMGQQEFTNGRVKPGANRYDLMCELEFSDESDLIKLTWIDCESLADGAPALADWLYELGCTEVKYIFYSANESEPFD